MALVSLNCPNCGGSLKMEDTMDKGFCMYCGTSFLVKDEIQRVKVEHSGSVNLNLNREREIKNLLIRAEQKITEYEMSSNAEFANSTIKDETYESIMKDYIEKAFDIEPNFPKALELKQRLISVKAEKIDKAKAAAKAAKIEQIRFSNKLGFGCIIVVLVFFFLLVALLNQCGR